ncbi:MAG: sugar phosphate isomerase/epimerase family protein [Candidatus Hodarchaeota archaeon]
MVELGFLSAYFNGMPLEKCLRSLAKYGYTMVEVGAQTGHNHVKSEKILSGGATELKKLVRDEGYEMSALCSHVNHLHPDEKKRKELNDFFKKNIEAAAALDVDCLTTFSGSPTNWKMPGTKEWGLFKEVFDDLTDFAKDHGCNIAIEVHFGSMTYNTKTMRKMFEVVPAKNLGLNFDPSHFIWQLIDAQAAVEEFPDRVFHTHAKDVKVFWDKIRVNGINDRSYHDQRMPGWGDFDWKRFILFLLDRTDCDVLSVEHEDRMFFGEIGFEKAAQYLKPLLL